MLFGNVFLTDRRNSLPTSGDYPSRRLRGVERIVIHHAGGGVDCDYTADEIATCHVESNGWPGIGYHFLVHPDGRIEYVGDWLTARYHCGRLNATSIGICLAGDYSVAARPEDRQLMRTRMLVGALRRALGREVPVVGHRDLDPADTGYARPECPGTGWPDWRSRIG